MKVQVKHLSSCKTELVVEIEVEVWKRDYDGICTKYLRQAKVPGFRPGRAPLTIIQGRYGESIRDEFLETALSKYFRQAVEAESLIPLAPPQVSEVIFSLEKPVSFKATFEVLPTLDVVSYRGLEIDQVSMEVKDEDVELAIKQLQERMAEYLPIEDRSSQLGDHVVISLEGKYATSSRADIRDEEVYCELGGADTPSEFTDNLTEAECGDVKTFKVKYPQDHPNKELAGQDLQYSVELKAIKRKQVPELSDEFAKDCGDYTSLEELKTKIRADCTEHKGKTAHSEMQSKLVDIMLAENHFEVPEALVREQLEVRVNDTMRALMMQGVDPKTLKLDWNVFQEKQREQAIHDVKAALVLEYIAEKEDITVSEEEVEQEIALIAQNSEQSVETVKSQLTKNKGTARISGRLRNRKSLELILSLASIKTPPGLIVQP